MVAELTMCHQHSESYKRDCPDLTGSLWIPWKHRWKIILDCKLSPCFECCILSLGDSPGFWILCDDVSEQSSCSIFIDGVIRKLLTPPMKIEQTGCSETSAHKIQKPGDHPKEIIQHHWRNFLNRTTTAPFHILASSPAAAVQSSIGTPLKSPVPDVTTQWRSTTNKVHFSVNASYGLAVTTQCHWLVVLPC